MTIKDGFCFINICNKAAIGSGITWWRKMDSQRTETHCSLPQAFIRERRAMTRPNLYTQPNSCMYARDLL